jgi:hypothetical protein
LFFMFSLHPRFSAYPLGCSILFSIYWVLFIWTFTENATIWFLNFSCHDNQKYYLNLVLELEDLIDLIVVFRLLLVVHSFKWKCFSSRGWSQEFWSASWSHPYKLDWILWVFLN